MKLRPALLTLATLPVWAAPALTLPEAIRTALDKHPSIEASTARTKAAETRVEQARGGLLPKVNYAEGYQRGNNPVFVFGSLLTQHQFGEQNFRLDLLNRPDALNNFQSQLSVDQVVYDAGQTRSQVRMAEMGRGAAAEEGRRTRMGVIAAVARAYYGAGLAQEALRVAGEAVRSAEADLERAEAVRAAGMATDADVLSIRVHVAGMKEQEINRRQDLNVARAALNEALGLPLDTAHDLSTPLAPVMQPERPAAELEKQAVSERPEARQAGIATRLAETQAAAARSSLLPRVGVNAVLEADRQRFVNRGGANWFIGASLRWNLFNGFSDRARIEEASQSLRGAKAVEQQTANAVRLQVRQSYAGLKAAEERIAVAEAAIAQAEESLRITKNRYEAGLATVTELLRSETALLEVRTRRLAAIHDQRVAAAMLELAAGTLDEGSDSLK